MNRQICWLSSVFFLVGCSSTMKSDFDCNVPSRGVCDSLGTVNRLVNNGYFDEDNLVPTPDFQSNTSIWVAEEE